MILNYGLSPNIHAPMVNVKVKAAKYNQVHNNVFDDISFYTSIGGPMLHELLDVCYFDTLDFMLRFDIENPEMCRSMNHPDCHFLIRSFNRFGLSIYILTNLQVYYRVHWDMATTKTDTLCDLCILDMGKCIDYKIDIDNTINTFLKSIALN